MLIHSLACLVAGALTTANPAAAAPSISSAVPAHMSAGDPATMSIDSVLARLEQVSALREIALRSGRSDRLADLDALEARLFDLAQQLAAGPLSHPGQGTQHPTDESNREPAAQGTGTGRIVAERSDESEMETPSRRKLTDEIISPAPGMAILGDLRSQFEDLDEEGEIRSSRRVIPTPLLRKPEENRHPLSLLGAMRRAIPDQLAFAPGTFGGSTGEDDPPAPALSTSGRRTITDARSVPSTVGTMEESAARRSTTTIDEALRELRTDIVAVPR